MQYFGVVIFLRRNGGGCLPKLTNKLLLSTGYVG